jgi:hypothetical protein
VSSGKGKPSKALEVTVMFEPNRMATEYLVEAYAQVVPAVRRVCRCRVEESTGSEPAAQAKGGRR